MNVCLLNCIMSLKNSANFLSAMECEEFNELAPRFYLRANNCKDFYYVATNMCCKWQSLEVIVNLDGHVTRYDGHSKLLSPVKASNSQVSLWNGIARLTKQIFFWINVVREKVWPSIWYGRLGRSWCGGSVVEASSFSIDFMPFYDHYGTCCQHSLEKQCGGKKVEHLGNSLVPSGKMQHFAGKPGCTSATLQNMPGAEAGCSMQVNLLLLSPRALQSLAKISQRVTHYRRLLQKCWSTYLTKHINLNLWM